MHACHAQADAMDSAEHPHLVRAPHTSPAQAYVDDAVPMSRDETAQKVVQDLMQKYKGDDHLVWSAEKMAVQRRVREGGMALDVGDRVAWLERAEEPSALPGGSGGDRCYACPGKCMWTRRPRRAWRCGRGRNKRRRGQGGRWAGTQ